MLLPPGSPPDLFVRSLPLAAAADSLALLEFLVGFAATTGMAVTGSIDRSTIASNDLVGLLLLPRPG